MAVLIGCSERYTPTVPIDKNGAAPAKTIQTLSGVGGQQIPATVSGSTVIASTNFAGEISAVAQGCSVSPLLQNAVETPGSGGMKTAAFTVSGVAGGCTGGPLCFVTVTDKKNNSVTVQIGGQTVGTDCV